ncbi:MAG: hypothetical protein JSW27_12360 [Phycisphaerales bacterium]|nr:MAG: hypothetical protein JSW27_12360 [Phycisphaerales bacterium]
MGVRRWVGARLTVGDRLGTRVWLRVGARLTDGAGVDGLRTVTERLLLRVDRRGAVGADRLCVTTWLRERLEIDGAERRILGAQLRLGIDRRGAGRATEREGARLGAGADRLVCALLCDRAWLRLLLRRELCASAASDSSSTAAMASAARATPRPDFVFARNIIQLLSPAICFSGNPGLPFPHHRRHRARHVRSCDI